MQHNRIDSVLMCSAFCDHYNVQQLFKMALRDWMVHVYLFTFNISFPIVDMLLSAISFFFLLFFYWLLWGFLISEDNSLARFSPFSFICLRSESILTF